MTTNNEISIQSLEQLSQIIMQGSPLILYFSGDACNVCHSVLPQLKDSITNHSIPLAVIRSEDHQEICGQHLVFTVPTILVFYQGKEVLRESRFIDFQRIERMVGNLENNC